MENAMITVAECAKKWDISERTVRNYCARQRIPGAVLKGKTWWIPASAERPVRQKKKDALPTTLLERLRVERQMQLHGGIYHKVQIDLTYNSNHMEGSRLTHDQTRFIYETNTIGAENEALNVDDVVETANHFRCIDLVIDKARAPLTEALIKELHRILKSGTSDSRKTWFAVGDYKKVANEVGGQETTPPKQVHKALSRLLTAYQAKEKKTLNDLLDFHVAFERIHPFQDGNGRIGRLILLKECLHYGIVPFIIDERHRMFYYRGIREWDRMPGYLQDTCLLMQDDFKAILAYFEIETGEGR
jgi:Fic family protein